MSNIQVGERIWIERRKKGMSQNDLQRLSGVSQGYISKIEHDGYKISLIQAKKISDALELDNVERLLKPVTLDEYLEVSR